MGPFTGVVADRFERKRLLLWTQSLSMLQALSLAVLVLTGMIQTWQIIALSPFIGVVNAFDIPIRQSFVVQMVERREDFGNAIGIASLALSRVFMGSVICLVIAAFGMITQIASSDTLIQTIVDQDKRGRIINLYAMSLLGVMPFGSLLAGSVAARIGVQYTLLAGSVCCLLGAAVFAGKLPVLCERLKPVFAASLDDRETGRLPRAQAR